jgi:hypothetical protein
MGSSEEDEYEDQQQHGGYSDSDSDGGYSDEAPKKAPRQANSD